MRKLLLVFSFLFLNSLLAQTYLPMLEEDNQWSVDHFYYDPFGIFPDVIVTNDIFVAGDTVINGVTYTSVFFNEQAASCLLREENGIVYRYHSKQYSMISRSRRAIFSNLRNLQTINYAHITKPLITNLRLK